MHSVLLNAWPIAESEADALARRIQVVAGPGTCRACLAGDREHPEPLCTQGYCWPCHNELRDCAAGHADDRSRGES